MECQKHDDYQESLRWLLAFIQEYAKYGRDIGDKGKENVTAITKVSTSSPVLVPFFSSKRTGPSVKGRHQRDQDSPGAFRKREEYGHRH